MLDDKEIQEIMSLKLDVKEIVNKLTERALENGGKDNITVIVLEIKKKVKINYKLLIITIIALMSILIVSIIIASNNKFEIIKDGYSGAMVIGESYELEYKGNAEIEFSNDNIKYSDGKIIAEKSGTTEITIKNKKGEILYKQTIKIFPN